MPKPTIGRRVWYHPSSHDRQTANFTQHDWSQPLDAGICYVWNDQMINVTVADQNGVMHARTSVRLLAEGEAPIEGMAYATWMPYQLKAAEKEAATT